MEIRVAKIASIEFRHDYFKEGGTNWTETWPKSYQPFYLPKISATTSTKSVLQNLGLVVKTSAKGFDVFAEVKTVGNKLFLKKHNKTNLNLNFYVLAPDTEWAKYTRQNSALGGIHYFSNTNGFKTGGAETALYLHNEIAASAAGKKGPGTLVRKSNKVFEALELTSTQPPGAKWADLGTHTNFTVNAAKIAVKKSSLLLTGGPFAGKTIGLKNNFGALVLSKTIESDSTITELNIDLESLPEGKYSFELNGVFQEVFWVDKIVNSRAIAVLNLVLQGNPAEINPSLLLNQEWLPIGNNSAGLQHAEINPTTFVIHFLPNRAKWKYILNKNLAINQADSNAAGYQKLSDTEYLSKDSLTLNKQAKGADFGLTNPLPAPQNSVLKTLKNGSNEVENYLSEIFVNV